MAVTFKVEERNNGNQNNTDFKKTGNDYYIDLLEDEIRRNPIKIFSTGNGIYKDNDGNKEIHIDIAQSSIGNILKCDLQVGGKLNANDMTTVAQIFVNTEIDNDYDNSSKESLADAILDGFRRSRAAVQNAYAQADADKGRKKPLNQFYIVQV